MGLNFSYHRIIVTTLHDCRPRNDEINRESLMTWKGKLKNMLPFHYTFNLGFLYELKRKFCLSKTVCGIFYFRFRFVFIKVYIFVQQNVIIPSKSMIIEKPHTV